MLSVILGWIIQSSCASIVIILSFAIVRAFFKESLRLGTLKVLYCFIILSLLMPMVFRGDFGLLDVVKDLPQVRQLIAENPVLYHFQDLNVNRSMDLVAASYTETALDPAVRLKIKYLNGFTVIWIVGFTLTALMWMMGCYHGSEKLKKTTEPLSDSTLKAMMLEIQSSLKIHRSVRLLQSRKLTSPVLLNAVEPAVVIPTELLSSLSEEELRFILIHEMCHLKNNDLVLSIVMAIVQCLFWFNPFVWLLGRFYEEDREIQCDMMVLKNSTEAVRNAYCQCLLTCCTTVRRRSRTNIEMAWSAKHTLKRRMEYILYFPKKGQYVLTNLMIASFAFALIIASPGSGYVVNKDFESSCTFDAYETLKELKIQQGMIITGPERRLRRINVTSRILYVGKSKDLGNYIVLQSGDQGIKLIGNCDSFPAEVGQEIPKGEWIAASGF